MDVLHARNREVKAASGRWKSLICKSVNLQARPPT
jgi:hypothetical protein